MTDTPAKPKPEPNDSTPAALREAMDGLDPEWIPFGPAFEERGGVTQHEVAEHFGQPEAEYAAVRRHVGVMHLPWRRVVALSGADVRDFLHRLMTQEIKGLTGGQTRRSLLLDQKGRVLADTVVHFGDENTWVELDAFDAALLHERLDAALFGEDVALTGVEFADTDETQAAVPAWQCFALLGPAAVALVEALREPGDGEGRPPLTEHGVHQVVRLRVPGESGNNEAVTASVCRGDDTGGLGLRLWVRQEHAATVYRALLDAAGYEALPVGQGDGGGAPDGDVDRAAAFAARRRSSLRGRPVGWSAYNTARVEAGVPWFHIDFGPDSLPAEAGIVDECISFTKGCYVGQEAVARMKNLGHPKKLLVGLRLPSAAIPEAGTQVFDVGDGATVVGAVTSSAVSPLRGGLGVAIAMVRWGKHDPGTAVGVVADGQRTTAEVATLDKLATN